LSQNLVQVRIQCVLLRSELHRLHSHMPHFWHVYAIDVSRDSLCWDSRQASVNAQAPVYFPIPHALPLLQAMFDGILIDPPPPLSITYTRVTRTHPLPGPSFILQGIGNGAGENGKRARISRCECPEGVMELHGGRPTPPVVVNLALSPSSRIKPLSPCHN
jgi:hypothetical protein